MIWKGLRLVSHFLVQSLLYSWGSLCDSVLTNWLSKSQSAVSESRWHIYHTYMLTFTFAGSTCLTSLGHPLAGSGGPTKHFSISYNAWLSPGQHAPQGSAWSLHTKNHWVNAVGWGPCIHQMYNLQSDPIKWIGSSEWAKGAALGCTTS